MPALVARSELIEEFAQAVATKLPEGVSVPAMDSIQSILAAEGEGLALFTSWHLSTPRRRNLPQTPCGTTWE